MLDKLFLSMLDKLGLSKNLSIYIIVIFDHIIRIVRKNRLNEVTVFFFQLGINCIPLLVLSFPSCIFFLLRNWLLLSCLFKFYGINGFYLILNLKKESVHLLMPKKIGFLIFSSFWIFESALSCVNLPILLMILVVDQFIDNWNQNWESNTLIVRKNFHEVLIVKQA